MSHNFMIPLAKKLNLHCVDIDNSCYDEDCCRGPHPSLWYGIEAEEGFECLFEKEEWEEYYNESFEIRNFLIEEIKNRNLQDTLLKTIFQEHTNFDLLKLSNAELFPLILKIL